MLLNYHACWHRKAGLLAEGPGVSGAQAVWLSPKTSLGLGGPIGSLESVCDGKEEPESAKGSVVRMAPSPLC